MLGVAKLNRKQDEKEEEAFVREVYAQAACCQCSALLNAEIHTRERLRPPGRGSAQQVKMTKESHGYFAKVFRKVFA